jgi:DNA-binding GntR family transcriptional regulator
MKKIAAPRKRLADLVYEQILAGLHSGEINPDERLHQERLAELLNVSRTPVREALLRLEQEGLLASHHNGGFEIREISETDVLEIYQTRQAIEGFCAGQLARSATPESLAALRQIVQTQEQVSADTSDAYYEANRAIHRAFVEATGNGYLLESFDALWNRSLSLRIFQTMDQPQLAASLSGHEALCDAIETGSFETAQKAMHDHIAQGCDLQLAAIPDALEQAQTREIVGNLRRIKGSA